MTEAPYLSINGISKSFGPMQVVRNADIEVGRGEFVSFLGPSGCGKTTILRMVAGFETPSTGSISIDGRDITYLKPSQRNIGMVFQSYALFPNLTVAGNIGFGLRVAGVGRAEIDQRVKEMLALIGLPQLADRFPWQLSGGQQQRVALARAIAPRPSVLLLDEPLSALDAKIRVSLREEIRAIQQELGITTIFVTHDQGEALSMADRIAVFNDGRIMQTGTPEEIYRRPRTRFVVDFVGSSNVLSPQLTERLAGVAEWSSLRPEDIRLGDEGGHEATVTGTSFLGSATRLTLDVAGEKISVLLPSGARVPAQGESVRISWNSDALHLMGAKA